MKHTMTPSDDAAWTAAIAAGKYDISLQCCGSPGLGPVEGAGYLHRQGWTIYSDPRARRDLFNKAAASGDATEQANLYKQAGAILNKAAPYDWLWAVAHTDAYTRQADAADLPERPRVIRADREVDAGAVARSVLETPARS